MHSKHKSNKARYRVLVPCKGLTKVCSYILIFAFSLSFSAHINAQEPVTEQQQESEKQAPLPTQQTEILRLEDTIRGNKEQPQVLTIVPWQLPVHQRINENKEWQPKTTKLPSIERNAFLRNLAVVNELVGQAQDAPENP